MDKPSLSLICLLLATVVPLKVTAQQPSVVVSLHVERLPEEEKLYVDGLDGKLQQLINDRTWVEGGYRYEVPMQVDLFFDKYTRSALFRRYSAGFLVSSRSGVQFRDRRWEFPYNRDERLYFGDPYSPLTGIVEFYVNLALGFELDRITPLGGDAMYQKARIIAQNARFEATYTLGWDVRREFADAFTDSAFVALRLASYYTEAGSYFLKNDNPDVAASHLEQAVFYLLQVTPDMMELRRDDHIIRFVDKFRLSEMLKSVGLGETLNDLIEWDPDNIDIYK